MTGIALLKFIGIIPIGLMMGYILQKYREAEDGLYERKISWTQYEKIRQSIIGIGGILFLFAIMLCSL